jgi:outer membrane immunogenic protein
MFKFASLSLLALGAAIAAPASAQSADDADGFTGFYVGGSFGAAVQPNDGGKSSILFDRNADGTFGDTVTTVAGADAFSPGFCGGGATSSAPGGCRKDKDGIEYMGRVGADYQRGRIVIGIVGEGGRAEITDRVSAFSTTPAFYTLSRSLEYNASIRGRLGYTPNNSTLFYGTFGPSYGKVRNSITTSNAANSFATNGKQDAWGFSAGGGVEQKLGKHFSIGLEYLYTDLNDDNSRVQVGPGTAPATNPFLLGNAAGTTFKRSDENFRWHSMRAVATFRF